MKVWSEQLGRHIEAEAVWAGVGPTPGELRSREGWVQKEAAVIFNRMTTGQEPVDRRGSLGGGVKGVIYVGGHCHCGNPVSQHEWKKKYRRCRDCRAKRAGVRKAAA